MDRSPRRRTGRARNGGAYGAVDLGTNNCRLLVARPSGAGFRVVDAFSRIVRLGEGVAHSGQLSDAAMGRTLAALKVCAGKLRRRGVSRYRAVATEACRRAENCAVFLERARTEAQIELEIISSSEEARLALDGCVPLLEGGPDRALLFDIGGGSTELIWVQLKGNAGPEVTAWTSLGCGVVGLAEHHGGDRVSEDTYEAMVAEVTSLLAPFVETECIEPAARSGDVQLIGTSGTVTTIAGVHLNLPRYDRSKVDGVRLGFADVRRVIDDLMGKSLEERIRQPCIGRGRGDVVIAGCAILEAVMRACPTGRLRVADRGLREGMLLGMMREDNAVP